MTAPRCPSCHQTLPADPHLCTCGHPLDGHHMTPAGRRTWCYRWEQPNGKCPCTEYVSAA